MSKKLLIFIAVSFGFSWTIAVILWLTGLYSSSQPQASLVKTLLLIVYMFGPAVGTIVSQKIAGEKLSNLGVSFKINVWWIVGILAIVSITLLTVFISSLMGAKLNTTWDQLELSILELYKNIPSSEKPSTAEIAKQLEEIGKSVNYNVFLFYLISLLSGIVAGITVNAVAAFGEEFGWRGFLFKEFENLGLIISSLVIGLIWGIWHAPIIAMGHNFPTHPLEGIFLMTLFCILLSFIMNYFREKGKSVVLSSMMHGTLNGTAGLYIYANTVKNDILYNITGVSGMLSILLIVALLLLLDRKTFFKPLQAKS
ncbi:MAG: CPBP family intramembrane glutamic endopeptidase [Brevinematia bacterium]